MCNSAAHNARKRRESVAKRLGPIADAVRRRDAFSCVYCGAAGSTLDHLTPRCRGGADVAANLVVACLRCNAARRALPLATWERIALERHGVTFSARAVRRRALRAAPPRPTPLVLTRTPRVAA